MKPEETIRKFIDLRAKGISINDISEELAVDPLTLIKWSKENNIAIKNKTNIELDSISSTAGITKHKRIKVLGSIFDKMYKELEGRDLSLVPTDKMIDYFLKYYAVINKEFEQPVFTEITHNLDPSLWENKITWTS